MNPMPHRRQLMRAMKRLKCWLWHRQTLKVMDIPRGRVQMYELGCRRCSQVWYVPAESYSKRRIKR